MTENWQEAASSFILLKNAALLLEKKRLIYGVKKQKQREHVTMLTVDFCRDECCETVIVAAVVEPNHTKVVFSAENRTNNPGNTCFSCTVYALCEAEFLRLFCCFICMHTEGYGVMWFYCYHK